MLQFVVLTGPPEDIIACTMLCFVSWLDYGECSNFETTVIILVSFLIYHLVGVQDSGFWERADTQPLQALIVNARVTFVPQQLSPACPGQSHAKNRTLASSSNTIVITFVATLFNQTQHTCCVIVCLKAHQSYTACAGEQSMQTQDGRLTRTKSALPRKGFSRWMSPCIMPRWLRQSKTTMKLHPQLEQVTVCLMNVCRLLCFVHGCFVHG